TVQQIMVLKDAISHEEKETISLLDSDTDDDEASYDEITDLFKPLIPVLAGTSTMQDIGEDTIEVSNEIDDLPPQKRQRPARYRD
ncbi:hypothetical protein EK21DRAFT_82353, partial [Setomelanomma holmii]